MLTMVLRPAHPRLAVFFCATAHQTRERQHFTGLGARATADMAEGRLLSAVGR